MGAYLEGMTMETPEDQNTVEPAAATAPAPDEPVAAAASTASAQPEGAPANPDKPAAKQAKAKTKPATKAKSITSESEAPITEANADPKSQSVEIFPLRSYQDAGGIRRRGGPGYTAPRRHADALVARGLASTEKPKAKPDSAK